MISIADTASHPFIADLPGHLATLPPFVSRALAARVYALEARDKEFEDMARKLSDATAAAVADYHARLARISNASASADDIALVGRETVDQIVARFAPAGEALNLAHTQFKKECQGLLREFYTLLVPVIERSHDALLGRLKSVYDELNVPFVPGDQPLSAALGRWKPSLRGWFLSESPIPPGPCVIRYVLGNFKVCDDASDTPPPPSPSLRTAAQVIAAR